MDFTNDTEKIRSLSRMMGYYLVLYVAPQGKFDETISVRDSNKNKKRKRMGKTVILPNGVSIKHGKYESNHPARRTIDIGHLKAVNGEPENTRTEQSIFADACILSYKVEIPFQECALEAFRHFETVANRYVISFLEDQHYLITKQKKKQWMKRHPTLTPDDFRGKRSDWRQLDICFENSPSCEPSDKSTPTIYSREAAIAKGKEVMEQLRQEMEKALATQWNKIA